MSSSVRCSPSVSILVALVLVSGATACSGLKDGVDPDGVSSPAGPAKSSPASSSSAPLPRAPEGSTPVGSPPSTNGAGAHGALPNGYCCSASTECRGRTCTNGMCIDTCAEDDGCLDMAGPFTCQGRSGDRRCVPSPTVRCVAAADFRRGTKKLGECCTATHDARAGLECEGGRCEAFGPTSNPYICGQACEKASDCPGAYMCVPGPYDFKICVPESTESYSCK